MKKNKSSFKEEASKRIEALLKARTRLGSLESECDVIAGASAVMGLVNEMFFKASHDNSMDIIPPLWILGPMSGRSVVRILTLDEYLNHKETDTILDALEDVLPDGQKEDARTHWTEFIWKFGDKGAKGFIGFIQWCRDNEKTEWLERPPVGHDILGRNEECMLPKTSGYVKYYKNITAS